MEDDAAGAAVEVVERGIQIEPLGAGDRLDHPGEVGRRVELGPDGDRALAEAQATVGDEHRRVGSVLDSQPLADRAPAQRAVEGEVVGLQLVEAATATVADAVLAVSVDGPARLLGFIADPRDVHDPLAQVERRFDRVGESGSGCAADDRPVDHDFDLVLAAVAQLGRLSRLTDSPSTRTRAKPEARSSSHSPSKFSPSRRSIGAIT